MFSADILKSSQAFIMDS